MTKEQWNKWKIANQGNVEALVQFAEKNSPDWIHDNIIYSDSIFPMLIPVMEEHDWKTVVSFLEDITDSPNEKFYGVNAFTGSLEKLTWDEYIDSLEDNLDYNNFFQE